MTGLRLIPPSAAMQTGSQVRHINTAHEHQSAEILVIRADISHVAIFQCFYLILNCSVFPPPFLSAVALTALSKCWHLDVCSVMETLSNEAKESDPPGGVG